MNIETLKTILTVVTPYIADLIKSTIVPKVKREAYEYLDQKADDVIEDLAQNAEKIKDEKNPTKKDAYINGTKLGIETIRAIAKKLNEAADEIEKAIA